MRRFSSAGLAGFMLVSVCCSQALADEPTDPEPTSEVLDATRRSVRSSAEWLARGVDGWFGEKPFAEGGKVSDGRLSVNLLAREHEGTSFGLRFNARMRLPNVQERAYLFLGSDDRRELVADKPDALSHQQQLLKDNRDEQSFFAGLGFFVKDSVQLRLGLRGGLKPYAQARYVRPWRLGEADLLEFRETLFWALDDRFGSTTAVSYEHALSSTLALRWLSSATISQRSKKFDWSSGLGAYKLMGAQRLLSIEALFNGTEGDGPGASDYGLQLKWEQPIHKDWLLGELIWGHFWPRPEAHSERGHAWAIGLGLKMKF